MIHSLVCSLSLVAGALDGGAVSPGSAPAALISRELLFGSADKSMPRISPDGRRLAWLAPDAKNVAQVWVRTIGQSDDAAFTTEKTRGLRWFTWGEDSKTILYNQDSNGDENFHLFAIDLSSSNIRDLTPWFGIRATLLKTDARRPDDILITLNLRDRRQADVWKVNLKTGAAELDTQNPGDVLDWKVDPSFTVRAAIASTPEGGTDIRIRESSKAPWKSWITTGLEENLTFIDFTNDNRSAFIASSISTDTQRVVEKNLKSGTERLLIQNPTSDPMAFFVNENKHVLNAVAFDVAGHQEWSNIEYGVKGDFENLKKVSVGDIAIEGADRADATWVVSFNSDVKSTQYFLWDRKFKKATFLFAERARLDTQALREMKAVTLQARDGLKLNGYLTLPADSANRKVPLVALVHGGPWSRDRWAFNPVVQLLANRGAAVLQINFRGSTGYGKQFLNAGNRQWGLAMHTDVVDGVKWALQQGNIDVNNVAIMGTSYGGYEALVGLTSSPDLFTCGVELVGPVNLSTLLTSLPPRWDALKSMMYKRVGNPTDSADAELLKTASPLFSVEKLTAPLLIGYGANDTRVELAEAEQLVKALETRSIRGGFALYPDEGHGLLRPENRLDFYSRTEAFLSQCLKTTAEPMSSSGRTEGSSVIYKTLGTKP